MRKLFEKPLEKHSEFRNIMFEDRIKYRTSNPITLVDMRRTITLLSIILLLIAIGCNEQKDGQEAIAETPVQKTIAPTPTKSAIDPPLKELTIKPQRFTLNPQKDTIITFKQTGTKIHIPKDVLVDADGKLIDGEVTISYREFHTVEDVFLSGIPMMYEKDGRMEPLQTAGMFEIRASQSKEIVRMENGKKIREEKDSQVFIKEGEAINVEMASYVAGAFNKYSLDEATGEWTELASNQMEEVNPEAQAIQQELEDMVQTPDIADVPVKPIMESPDDLIFKLNVKLSDFPELEAYQGLHWKSVRALDAPIKEEDGQKWEQVSEEEKVLLEALNKKWEDISIELLDPTNSVYNLTLGKGNERQDFNIVPVLDEYAYARAKAKRDEWEAKQDSIKARVKTLRIRQQRMVAFTRRTNIRSFGVYNYDRLLKERRDLITAKFRVNDLEAAIDKVYLIMPELRLVATYGEDMWDSMGIYPNQRMKLVAIFPDGKIATVGNAKLKKANTEKVNVFNLEPTKATKKEQKKLLKMLQTG